jgi:hypothetical protein
MKLINFAYALFGLAMAAFVLAAVTFDEIFLAGGLVAAYLGLGAWVFSPAEG